MQRVADRKRFDADPDPSFYIDADPSKLFVGNTGLT
jgi:hypothetical protein